MSIITPLVWSMVWTEVFLSSAFAQDSRCNVSAYETTQDLVYCVTNGVNYDKTRRPKTVFPRDDAVLVNVSIEIASLQVDTGDMDFSLEFFFRQRWHDPNLAYDEHQAGGKQFIVFKVDLVKYLWTPDTYIYGIKSIQAVQTDSAIPASEGLRISPNGDVLFSARLSMTISCSMQFHYFPMDKQKCFLNLTSFFYTDDDIHYEWKELTVLDKNIAHFELISFQKSKTIQEFTSGRYGRLTITFEFKRRINFYLLSWYVPATLIVVLSWVGFWIDVKSTPARISLGTITILAMGGFLIGGQEGFPQVSYIRAIDIYLITCFVFVFGCMVEYAVVHYAKRTFEEEEHKKRHEDEVHESDLADSTHHENKNVANGEMNGGFIEVLTPVPSVQEILQWNNIMSTWSTKEAQTWTTNKERKKAVTKSSKPCLGGKFLCSWATKLDEICRLAFPLMFLLIVIVYFIVFVILQ
ncbi:gamma-aminobutyric acid receptor subunit rho-2-like [Montipora capricornis]|uniref:gamma-aminobutyric acid receptor subunit rho-2-like n=1 Tax=Montipora capricornis TaxID=246305 RepID=UPI0035F17468